MRIGLFGGSFDPVHNGHLAIAQSFYEELQLEQVIFIPAFIAPQKGRAAFAPAPERLQMLRLALADYPYFNLSTVEIERQGISYTIDTVRHFRTLYPNEQLFLLVGGDSLLDLPHWREPDTLLNMVQVVVAVRPEHDLTKALPAHLKRVRILNNPLSPLSSSTIRRQIQQGILPSEALPPAVAQYIQEHHLYRT